jgi:hypothetical protein
MTRIYPKIAQESCGTIDVEAYAAFVRTTLAQRYPGADITIETTHDSGVMPQVIEAETWEEEDDIRYEMDSLWARFCQAQ